MSAYWRDRLLGVEPLSFPSTDRVTRPSYRGGSVAVPIGAELSQSLNEFARSNGTSLYTVLLAAFQALLFRITGQQDFVVGSPRSWRTATSKDTIGYFVDLLPMRGHVDGELAFSVWLSRVRAAAFGALRHEHPFVLIAEDFVHVRDVVPLSFQAAFTLSKRDLTRTTTAACSSSPKVIACATSATSRPSSLRSRLELRPSICRSRSRRPMAASRPSCSTRRTCSIPTLPRACLGSSARCCRRS